MTKQKIHKEPPEYLTQRQYEEEFRTNYQKTLLLINKALLKQITKDQSDVVDPK